MIKKKNQEKEYFLVDIEQEKEMLKQNLFEVEKANEVLKEQLEHTETETEHVQNISEELGIKYLRFHAISMSAQNVIYVIWQEWNREKYKGRKRYIERGREQKKEKERGQERKREQARKRKEEWGQERKKVEEIERK